MNWTLPGGVTRLILIRHGEPDEASRGRVHGRLDVALSANGRMQAARTAAWLAEAPLAAVHCSPRRRAVESARPLALAHALALDSDERLAEIDFGALEGLTWDEARARHPALYEAWMARPTSVQFPDGESWAELRARVLACQRDLLLAHAGRTVAVVAHAGVTRAILAEALHLPDDSLFRLDQSYAAVSIVDFYEAGALVRLVNRAP